MTANSLTLLPYFATIQALDNIYNSLKNNDGVRQPEISQGE